MEVFLLSSVWDCYKLQVKVYDWGMVVCLVCFPRLVVLIFPLYIPMQSGIWEGRGSIAFTSAHSGRGVHVPWIWQMFKVDSASYGSPEGSSEPPQLAYSQPACPTHHWSSLSCSSPKESKGICPQAGLSLLPQAFAGWQHQHLFVTLFPYIYFYTFLPFIYILYKWH